MRNQGVLRWSGVIVVTVCALQTGCLGLADHRNQEAFDNTALMNSGLPEQESAQVCVKLAETLAAQGHLPEAISQYEKARAYDPDLTQVSYPLALLYDRVGADDEALKEFQLALKAEPNNANILNDLGYYYYARRNWPEAERWLNAAVQADPRYPRAWINLGLTLGQQGRYAESIAAFEKVLNPAQARSNLAFVLLTQQKHDQAAQTYQEALALDPSLKTARAALAQLTQPQSRHDPHVRTAHASTAQPTFADWAEETAPPRMSVSGIEPASPQTYR